MAASALRQPPNLAARRAATSAMAGLGSSPPTNISHVDHAGIGGGIRQRVALPGALSLSSSPKPQSWGRSTKLAVFAKMPPPGFYGGPPLDRRIRKGWGGEPTKDPLKSDDYVWDTKDKWQRILDSERDSLSSGSDDEAATGAASATLATRQKSSKSQQGSSTGGAGFLSLGRSLALDSLDLDLSSELTQPSSFSLQKQVEVAREAAGDAPRPVNASADEEEGKIRWRSVAATNRQAREWRKQRGAAGKMAYVVDGNGEVVGEVDPQEQFRQLKAALLLYTVGLGVAFTGTAYALYSPEIAASFGVGVVGSLIYVRMLSSSVEALGQSDLQATVRGSLGQPRLLVPVLLVMTFNRWNALVAPEYDWAVPLQLIPMLLGFFTYKAATVVQTLQEILAPLTPPTRPPSSPPPAATAADTANGEGSA